MKIETNICSWQFSKLIIKCLFFTTILLSCSEKKNNSLLIEGRDIVTSNGMVVSAHPEASRIGAEILSEGGNAVDAAVAVEFALAVCYPEAGNIGGGGFMVIRTADGGTAVIDYREKAPARASRDMYLDADRNVTEGLSTDTHLAAGVPGTVDGMLNAHAQYGSLEFKKVIQPAIDLSRKGFRITRMQAEDFNHNRKAFIERNSGRVAFVKDSMWTEGEMLVQEDLAGTLERIRDRGRDGFYSGKTADLIISEMMRGNGIMEAGDLAEYRSVQREALTTKYRNYGITTVPPPSGGGIILAQMLAMTEPYPVAEWGFGSVKTIHLVAEAERRAFADRSEYHGDPEAMPVSETVLVNRNYLTDRMRSFNETRASASSVISAGSPVLKEKEQTTHYSVVDSEGNAVAATTTLNGTFGSSIVVEGAGFLLNNQMDDFSIKPGYPNMYGLIGGEVNSISPGKKMLSSMTPVIVDKDGKLFMVAGSPGGSTIPTTVYQVITNVIDHGMGMQEAVDAARFHHQWLPDWISYERNRIDSTTAAILSEMGHELRIRSSIGRVSAILINGDGQRFAGSDRRGDNTACGY
jgi:gamma-glutamyltranspeptidase / glutathione hydrolase